MAKSEEEVKEIVLRWVCDITDLPVERIRLTDRFVDDLRADSDELTFVFVPGVERDVGVHVPVKAWKNVHTVADAIHLVHSCQNE
jgi:acyl carrier protein